MKMTKFISGLIAVVLAMVSLTFCASAAVQDIPISVTLQPSTINTLIASATKSTSNTVYDEFSWTGGTTNSVTVWVKNEAGSIVGIKTKIYKNSGFTKIWYQNGMTFITGNKASMYAEQYYIASKTLEGTARFT